MTRQRNRKAAETRKPLQIVIADDEECFCEVYSLLLRKWFPKVSIRCFQDGLQAWQHLAQNDPDMLIMDLNRTRVDGIETLRRLAVLQKSYPVLVVSGCLGFLENKARTAAGSLRAAFMPKPWQLEDLRRELFSLIDPVHVSNGQQGKEKPSVHGNDS